ncbi:MAG: hypothetical protein ACO3JG_11620 [Luteolibacter sp.]
MTRRVSMRHKRKEAPQWVFPWQGLRQSPLPKIAAFLITLGVFAMMFAFVRIGIVSPTPWAARQATLFRTLEDAEGRALALRAREGGPFPSRFQPAQIDWLRELENQALSTAGWQPPHYEPKLRDLPAMKPPLPLLTAPGKPVMPQRPPPNPPPVAGKLQPVPTLQPLAGVDTANLPANLPDFADEVPPAMLAKPWRFLLRLDAAGRVQEAVPLSGGGNDAGVSALTRWLAKIAFPPDVESEERWIAVGLSFENRPADGTDAD